MIHLIFGLPWMVVVVRFIQPLPWPWWLKAAAAIILLIASQFHLLSRISSGSVFDPEFSRPLIIAFNVLLGGMLLLAVLQIAVDLIVVMISIVRWKLFSFSPEVRHMMAVLAFSLSAYGVVQAIRVPPLKDIEAKIPNLPPAFDGYQIIQLTDLHISRLFPAAWTEAVVARTNDLNADLIVMTGDLIDGSVEYRRRDVEPIAKLKARDGVYAIPGNHEYFFDYEEWMAHYNRLNLRPLTNSHTVIQRGGAALLAAGVTDLSAARTGNPPPDLSLAMKGAPAGAPVILLDHQPMMAEKAADARVSLQLSGHTHGGMIVGLAALVARANNGYVAGFTTSEVCSCTSIAERRYGQVSHSGWALLRN